MNFYCGFDLHSTNNFLGIIDQDGKKIFKKKLPNHPGTILEVLEEFKDGIAGIAIESTYNWYWLVDLLMDSGYLVHLASPSGFEPYKGLKYSDDKHDAFWLAEMLRLGLLPTGHIYDKKERPVRDLLRKRGHLMRVRTSLILSLQNMVTRNCAMKITAGKIKQVRQDHVAPYFTGDESLILTGQVSKETIDHLTRQIQKIERAVEDKIQLRPEYAQLLTIPGVGKTLGATITLETGPISRFPKVGDYASYCRKVPTIWLSNGKKKGSGNQRNGNKYLAWAFSEAAEKCRQFFPRAQAFYDKKKAKKNFMVAHSSLAHKLTRAAYYVMRDQVPFDPDRLFA